MSGLKDGIIIVFLTLSYVDCGKRISAPGVKYKSGSESPANSL